MSECVASDCFGMGDVHVLVEGQYVMLDFSVLLPLQLRQMCVVCSSSSWMSCIITWVNAAQERSCFIMNCLECLPYDKFITL